MAVIVDVTCLYSTVKSLADRRVNFAFLPPHGHSLAAGEELAIFGDVREAIFRGDRFGKHFQESLERVLEEDLLEIRNTPAVILEDAVSGAIKTLGRSGGAFVANAPCWESSITV